MLVSIRSNAGRRAL